MNYGFIIPNDAQDPQLKTATMEIMSEVWRWDHGPSSQKKMGGLNHELRDLMGFSLDLLRFLVGVLGFWLGISP